MDSTPELVAGEKISDVASTATPTLCEDPGTNVATVSEGVEVGVELPKEGDVCFSELSVCVCAEGVTAEVSTGIIYESSAEGEYPAKTSPSPRLSSLTRSHIFATWGSTNWRRWERKKPKSRFKASLIYCQTGCM